MQKFNKVTTESNIIKNLLASTYLPLIRSVREGDYICQGRNYILRCEIIHCEKSGYIGKMNYLSNTPIAEWTSIGEFHFGEKDGKMSTCYISNAEGYDYKTHERLGQYLRNLRDMYGLNLMPLYNCFSNQPLENHVIRNRRILKTSDTGDVKIYKVPIRFNQDYTIAIENLGETVLAPAFLRNNNLVKQNNTSYGNGIDISNQYISLHYGDNVTSVANTTYRKPFKIRFNNIPEKKEITFHNFTNFADVEYTKTINKNSDKPVYFDVGIPYYEAIEIENSDSDSDVEYEYFETQDISPYVLFEGDDFEEGVNYYVNNGYLFELTTDAHPESGEIYYTIDKDYYIKRNILAPSLKATYEITDELCGKYSDVEDTLYLLIQVPKTFDQNIVILEGDYTNIESKKFVDTLFIDNLPDYLYDKFYTHDLNLLMNTSKEPRPFSPMLIEYLLWNAISNLDTINNDFDRIAPILYAKYIPNTSDIIGMYPNYWVDRYRQIISDYISENSKNTIQDNIGYITTDVEKYMNKDTL